MIIFSLLRDSMPKYIVRASPRVIPTSGSEIDRLIDWLKTEVRAVPYGKVGLLFTLHQGQIVAIEKTTSVRGKFELKLEG